MSSDTAPSPSAAQLAAWEAQGVACAPATLQDPYRGPVVGWTARLDGYDVTLSGTWERSPYPPGMPVVRAARLTLVDPHGHRSSVELPAGVTNPFSPAQVAPGPSTSAMCLMRFAGDELPAVVLGAGAQGLHDFSNVVAVPITPGGLGRPSVDMAMADGWTTVFAGHAPLLSGDDGAFTYAPFSYFANHVDPPLLLSVQDGRIADVTDAYPALVAPDIDRLWSTYRQEGGILGAAPLTAWVAVECSTGHQATAVATLQGLAARGAFEWPASQQWPTGKAFVAALVQATVSAGYCTALDAS